MSPSALSATARRLFPCLPIRSGSPCLCPAASPARQTILLGALRCLHLPDPDGIHPETPGLRSHRSPIAAATLPHVVSGGFHEMGSTPALRPAPIRRTGQGVAPTAAKLFYISFTFSEAFRRSSLSSAACSFVSNRDVVSPLSLSRERIISLVIIQPTHSVDIYITTFPAAKLFAPSGSALAP